METNNFDELMYSLPDYITGELNDEDTKQKIEAKLLTDSSFREEYDSLKATMNFLTETELESPSEVYFANLQASILSKVHAKKEKSTDSLLVRLAGYWKVFVPALTVCVVIVIYSASINKPTLSVMEEKIQIPSIVDNGNKKTSPITIDTVVPTETPVQESTETSDGSNMILKKNKKAEVNSPEEKISADENTGFNYDSEGSTIFGKDDDTQTQDEYENLSPDDQLDILNSLKEKKI